MLMLGFMYMNFQTVGLKQLDLQNKRHMTELNVLIFIGNFTILKCLQPF